jgi:predicted membrane channel-forming protein YqfA (hemolysin III family)
MEKCATCGTATPNAIVNRNNTVSLVLLGLSWPVGIAGVAVLLFTAHRTLAEALFVAMGVMVLVPVILSAWSMRIQKRQLLETCPDGYGICWQCPRAGKCGLP